MLLIAFYSFVSIKRLWCREFNILSVEMSSVLLTEEGTKGIRWSSFKFPSIKEWERWTREKKIIRKCGDYSFTGKQFKEIAAVKLVWVAPTSIFVLFSSSTIVKYTSSQQTSNNLSFWSFPWLVVVAEAAILVITPFRPLFFYFHPICYV